MYIQINIVIEMYIAEKIEPSEELAYWTGVVQSDGSFKSHLARTTLEKQFHISLNVSEQSLPMQSKFIEFSAKLFNRHAKSYKENNRNSYDCKISVKRLLGVFEDLDIRFGDPPKPPRWCETNPALFGGYLAGLLDGDGSVWLAKKKNKQRSDCHMKISSGQLQIDLIRVMSKFMKCAFRLIPVESLSELDGRIIRGSGWDFEFLVSGKNYKFFEEFVLPYIAIPYKRERLKRYIEERWPQ